MLRLLRNPAAVYLASGLLARAGAFLLVPLYTRRLTPEDYSQYATFTTFQPLLLTICSLGLTSAIARSFYAARDGMQPEDTVGDVARGMLGIGLSFGLVGSLVILLFLPGALLLDQSALLLLLWSAIFTNIGTIPEIFLRLAQKPFQASALRLLTFFLTVGFGLLMVVSLKRGGHGAIESITAVSLMQGALGFWFIFRRLGKNDLWATLKAELRLSLPFIPHTLALWVQQVSDRAFLSAQKTHADDLGIYYLAIQLSTPLALVADSWNSAQVPQLGEAYREGGQEGAARLLRRQYLQYGGITLLAALGLLSISPLLPWVIGARFRGAISLLPPLALASVLEALYLPSVNFLMITGHTRLIPVATWLSAGTSLGLVAVLLPRLGLPGLLLARVLSAAIRAIAMGGLVWKNQRPHR